MIDTNDSIKFVVIPKWIEYSRIIQKGDLSILRNSEYHIDNYTKEKFLDDYKLFKTNPDIYNASDIMGAAYLLGEKDIALDVAKYLIKKGKSNKLTLSLAEKILYPNIIDNKQLPHDIQISKIRSTLKNYPRNSILWVDLARLYTIKNKNYKARRAIMTALQLSPIDRFIVRAAVRFFIHNADYESAEFFIQQSLKMKFDPWIKASEISISQLLKKDTKREYKYLPKNMDKIQKFHFSELIANNGVLEMNMGNISRAKKNFRLAWENPSDNVITHGEWIIRNKLHSINENTELDFNKSSEAMSWQFYYNLNLKEALDSSIEWSLEEPYSSGPFIFGSFLACNLDDALQSEKIAKQGLLTNPRDFFLHNNLCFNYLQSNKINDALRVLKTIPNSTTHEEEIFFLATKGLLEFKLGHIDKGRNLYQEAIFKSKKIHDYRLVSKAILNLTIAELEAKSKQTPKLIDDAFELTKNIIYPDIVLLRTKLENLWNKSKDNFN